MLRPNHYKKLLFTLKSVQINAVWWAMNLNKRSLALYWLVSFATYMLWKNVITVGGRGLANADDHWESENGK